MNKGLIYAFAGAAMLTGTSAHALFVDFTGDAFSNIAAGDGSVMVTQNGGPGGLDFTLMSTGGSIDTTESVADDQANFCLGTLGGSPDFSCAHDGIGIGSSDADNNRDEIDSDETLKVSISETVEITAIYLLDFFFTNGDNELAFADYSGSSQTFEPVENFDTSGNGFAAFTGLSVTTNMITFSAGDGNDNQGVGDFALAGIEFNVIETEAIPLPGALPLLLTGIAGLGFFGWRRRAQA
ncbi:MAG: hypothetical protein AAGC57_09450 [Pseudomonadota bacterium]